MTAPAFVLDIGQRRTPVGYRVRCSAWVGDAAAYVREHFPDARNVVGALGAVHFDAPYTPDADLPRFVERLDPR